MVRARYGTGVFGNLLETGKKVMTTGLAGGHDFYFVKVKNV